VLDMLRKMMLTAFILLIDIEYGATKILRIIVAGIISAGFLTALALAHPHKRRDDFFLAVTANLLLVCCFVSAVAIKLCEDDQDVLWATDCFELVGLHSSVQATLVMLIASVAMLVVALAIVGWQLMRSLGQRVRAIPYRTRRSSCRA